MSTLAPVMTSALLARAGEALYGPRWQSELARELDVDDRTVRRWLSGERGVPDSIRRDLVRLLRERAGEIGDVIPELTG